MGWWTTCARITCASGFTAAPVGGGMIQVARPEAPTQVQERREVLMHLRVWEVVSPGVSVTLVS